MDFKRLELNEGLDWLNSQVSNSWIARLNADPETAAHQPNKTSRQVKSGHYVLVKPDPLLEPWLVATSSNMLQALGLDKTVTADPRFARVFSGDIGLLSKFQGWATPYALSIRGQEMYENCPFGNGNGYGDGRAISIAEVVNPASSLRWELQLKGAGKTPFCRGGDGRAVLRSSVREFLVSEAMHELGVSTTRALSLVASKKQTVKRPWYSGDKSQEVSMPSINDPRLSHIPMQYRMQVLEQLKSELREPNEMQDSICAITCRVAPSFMRVGHLELFGRRARSDKSRVKELEQIVEHALFREYPEANVQSQPLQVRALEMARQFSVRLSKLTADWVRVGYCQGNFNSDNCLVGGRTMDYGPFGFIEKFEALWNMWTGGGKHFAFMNQPKAGEKNFESFASALVPMLDANGKKELQEIVAQYPATSQKAMNDMWRSKLGLSTWTPASSKLIEELLVLLEDSQADYTMFWRQLATLPERHITVAGALEEKKEASLLQHLEGIFYRPLSPAHEKRWNGWLDDFLSEHGKDGATPGVERAKSMRSVSPKYVPREWMLVAAYTAVIECGDASLVHELQQVFAQPFAEHPEGVKDCEAKYYRKAALEAVEGVGVGGTSFMS